MKKLLIILTIVCLVLPSCKKTPVITLSVDKSEISANGVDVAKFKVICNGEDNVTQKAHIFFADTNKELTNKTFSTTEPKTYSFYATYDDAKSGKVTVKAIEVIDEGNDDENNDDNNDDGNDDNNDDGNGNDDEEIVVKLSVGKTSIVADGKDAAVFNVTANGNALSDNYQVLNVADSSLVENATFVTTEAGIYTFVALYNEVYSNEVTIEAKAVEEDEPKPTLKLEADKTEIYNDGVEQVSFTVYSDENVLADGYQILNVENNTPLTSNVFSTTETGTYTFMAVLEDDEEVKSNEIRINVIEKPDPVVELKADKTSIKNDGVDKVTFTVLVDGEDRTEESVILSMTYGEEVYDGTSFSTETAGEYTFKARWNNFDSEIVMINVHEPQAYAPGDLYDVNGVKGVVFYVEEDGMSGLIMSMDQEYLQWSTEYAWANCLSNKGEWNTEDMLKLGADKYPAAKWCVEHGEGWYMPSSYEMNLMWAAISDGKLDFDYEFVKLYNDKLDDPILEDYYWSSSEISDDMAEVVVFVDDSVVCLEPKKDRYFHVRAIRKF